MRRSLMLQALSIFSVVSFAGVSYDTGQGILQKKISLQVDNMKIKNVLKIIEQNAATRFGYQPQLIDSSRTVSLMVEDTPVISVLNMLFDSSVKFDEVGGMVIFKPAAVARAESVLVSGKVTDETGAPMPGVNVLEKGTANGTVTDAHGKYSISVNDGNSTLVFSFIGYLPSESEVGQRGTVDVTMNPDVKKLEEVVVVSYGKISQRNITGAITKVNAADVQDVSAAELGQKLYGKVAGLQINQVTGRPGQGLAMRIRGAASLSASNQPLVVRDGQPITGELNVLNPDDIESFSVLKDAASTALYGSRAANGVILITTKQGKAGKTTVNFNMYYGVQAVGERGKPEVMNAREFATFMKGYFEDKIKYENWPDPTNNNQPIVPAEYRNPEQYGGGTDWYKALLREAPIQNYNLNISTGTEKLLSSTSVTYFNQQGVLLNNGMQRGSFRSNNEYRPTNRIKLGFNINPTYQVDRNTRGSLDGNRQILVGALISSPLIPVINPDGTYPLRANSYNMLPMANNYFQLKTMNIVQNNFRLLANAYFDVELLKNLHLKTALNTDLGAVEYDAFYPSTYGYFNSPPPSNPSAAHSSNNAFSWLSENTITYNLKVRQHHTFDFLAGYSAQRYDLNFRNINGNGFAGDNIPWTSGASTTTGVTNNTDWNLLSVFGRIGYDYKGKYFLTGTLRRDGSSRFGRNKRWGTFPSVSAGWVVSDESFFPKSKVVNFLKLKGSYGITGNNRAANDYNGVSLLSSTNYVFSGSLAQGQSITTLGNPDVTWELSKQFDAGLETTWLDGRITFSYDYYRTTVSDMLYQINLSLASGYNFIVSNVAEFRMWGHEFAISSRNLKGPLAWNTNFNISFQDNRVIKLQGGVPIGGINRYSDFNRTAEGRRIGELYGYVFEGVYMNKAEFDSPNVPKESSSVVGSARMKDVNGDGKITGDDRTFIGNPHPKVMFGITNDFKYKKMDLNIIISGQAGNYIMNVNKQNLQNIDGVFNMEKGMANRWRSEENPGNGLVPCPRSNTTDLYRLANTNWVSPGDYLTVRNITLGYTLDNVQLKYIKSARIYLGVQQALVLTKYPGQNPEVNDNRDNQTRVGTDNGSYPVPRTVMLGLNVNF